MADQIKRLDVGETEGSSDGDNVLPQERYNWLRGVFFQATVVGLCAFAAPGLWNAMSSVGAGGQQTPYLVMAGNAVLFSLMTFTCLTGSVLANQIGLKYLMILGTTGYVLYSAALYQNNRYGTVWFIYVGSAACGITAGWFWAAEGAIMLSYPPPESRGKYLAYWLAYRNSGAILGGAINLGFNASGKRLGKLDWRTYIVFVVLQCLGPAVAMLLSPPEKVQRRNGTKVKLLPHVPAGEEIRETLKLMLRKEFFLLVPYFLYVTWSLPYIGSYMTTYFSVRSRALASLVTALAQVLATGIMGTFLDWKRLSLNKRAIFGFLGMMTISCGTWVWALVIQHKYQLNKPALDWADSAFGEGWALYVFQQVEFALTYNYGYWVLGFLAKRPAEVVRYSSVARGVEAAGQCIASGISSTKSPLIISAGLIMAWWGIALIPGFLVVRQIGIEHVGAEGYVPELKSTDSNADEQSQTGTKV
ncbi:MFS general substrate transporter [Aaosphaeria arxii CBS 175.79]|uniref:MFS general substrate transporter n=1 Tax=Aaosphaeria arxii CBS 175.79 TaxID=1450172 RepID=A0A6A5XXF7_9PLEO|nr:MFS general substrate transporter [Aaosphaeria arxii CBS 175.79]KAF2017507.1 MFS general substrate transporter [Aaosphaeria arxii CBS 175.79]